MTTQHNGFTLLELMIVVAMIGILASVALPSYQVYLQRTEVVEAVSLSATARDEINHYYKQKLSFPTNNIMAGLPAADKLIGNRVTAINIENGAVHITLGNKIAQPLQGKVLTYRPAVVTDSPSSPISWLCGHDEPVEGMQAVGDNKTTVPPELLPHSCR